MKAQSLPHTCVMNNHGSLKYGLLYILYSRAWVIMSHDQPWLYEIWLNLHIYYVVVGNVILGLIDWSLLCTNLKSQKEITCESLKFWKSPTCCHHSGGLCMRWTPTETLPTALVPFSLSSFSVSRICSIS